MKNRIGLVSSKSFGHSTTKYVEVADAAEIAAALKNAGATHTILYWRDRFGDGHTEGQEFSPSTLSDTQVQWLIATPKDGMRGLFYDSRA